MSNETILPPAPAVPYRILDAFAVFSFRDKEATQLVCVCEDERVANDLAAQPSPVGKPGFVRTVKILTTDGLMGNILAIGEAVVILPRLTTLDEIRKQGLDKLTPVQRIALGHPAT